MTTVYVTNKWDKPISFSFEYVPYTFPVGETVEVPLEGLKILSKILITDQPPKKGHSLSPVVEKVPLPPSVEAGGKFNAAAA